MLIIVMSIVYVYEVYSLLLATTITSFYIY